MSRNTRTFDQLFNYMKDGAEHTTGAHFYTRNLYTRQGEEIINEFMRNSRRYKERANGVHLYHEVISLTRSKTVPLDKQKECLLNIVNEYCNERCPNNLVAGFLHEEHQRDIHYHLMISANELDSSYKHRLDKKAFEQVKANAELNVLKHYPQLEQVPVITKEKQGKGKYSNKEQQMKQRTKQPSHKDQLIERLRMIFEATTSPEHLFRQLADDKLELYTRGKHTNIKDIARGSKHRLATLNLTDEFQEVLVRLRLEPSSSPYQQAKGRKDTVKDLLKEAATGDFSEREKRAKKAKWKKQQKADESVKDFKEQTATEKFSEVGKEWVMGDFSNREARERNKKSKENIDAWKAKQANNPSDTKEPLSAKDKAKEWLAGDFSAREERAAKDFDAQQEIERRKARLKKQRETNDKSKAKQSPDKSPDFDV
jgi:hypothetical protein